MYLRLMTHLVFLHGFLEDASMWQPVLDRVSKSGYRIHLPELPGHGKNPQLPSTYAMDVWVENIMNQLDIPAEEQFIFIGHSMGGYVGASLAMRYGHRIKAFCAFHSRIGDDPEEKKENRLRAIEAAKENRERYIRMMVSGIFHPEFHVHHQDKIDKQLAIALEVDLATIEASHTVMRGRPNAIPAFQERNFPLFYFLGDQDSALPKEIMEAEIAQLPGSAVLFAPHTGHMGYIECPHVAGEFVQRMLRSVM